MKMFNFLKRLFKKDNKSKKNKTDGINEWSYQRFAGFYDERVLLDPLFNDKIKSIIDCVNNKKMDSIDEIAKVSNCTFDECSSLVSHSSLQSPAHSPHRLILFSLKNKTRNSEYFKTAL